MLVKTCKDLEREELPAHMICVSAAEIRRVSTITWNILEIIYSYTVVHASRGLIKIFFCIVLDASALIII